MIFGTDSNFVKNPNNYVDKFIKIDEASSKKLHNSNKKNYKKF